MSSLGRVHTPTWKTTFHGRKFIVAAPSKSPESRNWPWPKICCLQYWVLSGFFFATWNSLLAHPGWSHSALFKFVRRLSALVSSPSKCAKFRHASRESHVAAKTHTVKARVCKLNILPTSRVLDLCHMSWVCGQSWRRQGCKVFNLGTVWVRVLWSYAAGFQCTDDTDRQVHVQTAVITESCDRCFRFWRHSKLFLGPTEKKGVCFGLPDRPHSFCPDRKHFFAKVQECVKIEEEASKKHLTIELRMDFFVSRLLM